MTAIIRGPLLLVLLGWPFVVRPALAEGPPRQNDTAAGFRQLGKLRAGLAFQAREEEHDSLKAAHFYLQAAQAFSKAGDEEFRKALVAGVLAARPLRATWVHPRRVVAMTFLPWWDKEILTCGAAGDMHVWDAGTGREVRSFQAEDAQTPDGKIAGAVFSRDRSRLLLWGFYTVQLWDVGRGKLLRTWKPDPLPKGAAFLQEDSQVLTWGFQPPARLWDVVTGKELRQFPRGFVGRVPSCLGLGGTRLVTADQQGVYLWDVTNGKLLQTFPVQMKYGRGGEAAFSPDGKQLVMYGFPDGSARLFEAKTGRPKKSFPADLPKQPFARVVGVAFSPNADRLLTWGDDGKVRLWDTADAGLLQTFQGDGNWGARFSPTGRHVLTFGRPALLWDSQDGKLRSRLGPANDAVFGKGENQVLLLGARAELWGIRFKVRFDQTLLFLDLGAGARFWLIRLEGLREYEYQLLRAFDPTSRAVHALWGQNESLLVGSEANWNGAVRLWNLRQPTGARSVSAAPSVAARVFRHQDPVLTAALSRDEKSLLTCDAGGAARLWDVAGGKQVQSFAHGPGARGALFSPDDSQVLTWGEGGTARLWDATTGKQVQVLKDPANLRGAAFGPDGSHLLTWNADYTARWWDLTRGKELHQMEHDRDLFGARLDPKGVRALTWSLDGTARVWDLKAGRLLRSLGHEGPVFGGAFGAGASRVWTWDGNGLHEWDIRTGKELRRLPVKGGVPAAELGPDNQRFLLRDGQGLIQYQDVASGKTLATFTHVFNVYGYFESVAAGVFNPDQTRALTWAGGGSVTVWDLSSGLKLRTFRHDKAVRGAAFTRDGAQVLTWGADGTARLWDAAFPRPLSPDYHLLELEVRSGLWLDEHGKLKDLSFEEWQDRRKKLKAGLRRGNGK